MRQKILFIIILIFVFMPIVNARDAVLYFESGDEEHNIVIELYNSNDLIDTSVNGTYSDFVFENGVSKIKFSSLESYRFDMKNIPDQDKIKIKIEETSGLKAYADVYSNDNYIAGFFFNSSNGYLVSGLYESDIDYIDVKIINQNDNNQVVVLWPDGNGQYFEKAATGDFAKFFITANNSVDIQKACYNVKIENELKLRLKWRL